MDIPIFASGSQYVDNNGYLMPQYQLYNDQLNQALNQGLGINGIQATQATTAQITAREPLAAVGSIWFDTTLSKLVVKTAASTIETITST